MDIETKHFIQGLSIVGGITAITIFIVRKLAEAGPQEGDPKCVGFDLHEYQGGEWVLVETNSTACGWEPGEAEFQLSGLVIEPYTVNVGEPVTIGITVTNIGGQRGTKTVTLTVISTQTKSITLDPGQSGNVDFTITPGQAGIYQVNINGLAGSFEAISPPTFDPWVYDTDGNCYIEISEQLAAISDYMAGLITIDQLNEVIYLYQNRVVNPACPAPPPPPPPIFDPWVYDTNGSGYIEISEQLVAISDYMAGLITIDQLNEVIYLYENHIPRW